MPAPSVTYTFSNSTTADASQVNQNYTDIINGLSDGAKDLSISALTCAGNVTFNGNTTIGNASSDDVTITASLASTVNIKTTNSYNIGSATKGLQYIYLGQSGGANTTRLASSTLSSDVTLAFGTVSGTVAVIPDTVAIANSDSPYTALLASPIILANATSGAITVNLPTAVGNEGKRFVIKKTDSSTNAVTVDGDGTEAIDASATTTLNTQYESITIVSDGTNWALVKRDIPSIWTAYTPTITGSGSNPTKATTRTEVAYWRRVGDSMEIVYTYVHSSNAGAAAGTGAYLWSLPNSLTVDSAKLGGIGSTSCAVVGAATGYDGSTYYNGAVNVNTTSALLLFMGNATVASNNIGQSIIPLTSSSARYSFRAVIPIDGWKG